MAIIFLDFDGVLNRCTNMGFLITKNPSMLEPRLVHRVAKLVVRTQAQVVLSTAWRENDRLEWLRHLLHEHGLHHQHVVGMTPILLEQTRGEEIATFLAGRQERFVVLDDNDSGNLDMTPVRQHLVRTNPQHGFTEADLQRAQALLTTGPVWGSAQLIAV